MPTLASTGRGQIAYILEAVFGVTPGAGTPKDLRVTGETLDYAITKEQSAEINSTRAVSSVVATGATTSGGINAEMQYGEFDPLIAATLQSTWAAFGTNGVGSTFTADFTTTTITASVATAGANAFTTLKKGQWFKLQAGVLNVGKYFRVSKTTAPTSTVITLDPATPAVAETAAAGNTISTSRLTNGTTQTSYTIERKALDVGVFMAYRGQTPSKMSVGIQSGSLSSLTFDFMGKDMVISGSATNLPGGGTTTPSLNYDIHSGVSGITCQFWYDGVPLTGTYVKSITFDYDNALRAQDAVCTLGSVGVASGQIVSTCTMQIYFADATIYQDFLINKYPEIVFSSVDPVGNGYFFTLPKANISSVKTNMAAKDQDMMLDITFTCVRDASNADASLRQVVFIDRVGAAVV